MRGLNPLEIYEQVCSGKDNFVSGRAEEKSHFARLEFSTLNISITERRYGFFSKYHARKIMQIV